MATQMANLGRATTRDPIVPLREKRLRRIREVAYFKAEKRGFAPGHALEDWREAEEAVDAESRPLVRD